jgi:hypothetical protein
MARFTDMIFVAGLKVKDDLALSEASLLDFVKNFQ